LIFVNRRELRNGTAELRGEVLCATMAGKYEGQQSCGRAEISGG
jgi:hypothetical protein